MASFYHFLLPLLSLFFVRVDLTDLWPLEIPVKILRVYDGDTLLAGRGRWVFKVRLTPIDAPEKGQLTYRSKVDAGEFAGQCMRKLAPRKGILVVRGIDRYRRVLGTVDRLSSKMIEAGCASLYPYARFDTKKEKTEFIRALQIAKARRRGLWQYGGFLQPMKWRKLSKRSLRRR